MGANQRASARNKTRYSRDAVAARLFPIGITGVLESALGQHLPRLIRGKPHRLRDFYEHFGIADIAAVNEVSPVERVVNGFETRLRVCPFREFLGQTAVVGMGAPAVR